MKNLTNLERSKINETLLENSINGKPRYGIINIVAARFSVDRKTIQRLWKSAELQRNANIPVNVSSKKKGSKKVGRVVLDEEKLKSIDLLKRTTQHSLAENLGVSQSTVSRWVMSKKIRSHTNALKPGLTDKNKLARLIFSLQHLDYHQLTKRVVFKDQSNIIHMDEKWFSKTKPTTRFYLAKGETDPHRCVQSKSFIEKVMFMSAVGRPKYGSNGDLIFDGKIGIWPFVIQVPAQRNSKNRPMGTLETKCIESINKQVTKDMILNCVLPAIKAKWPSNLSKRIIIQQDNARPHFSNDDPDFRKAKNIGWSIQSLQQKKKAIKLDELIHNTVQAYEEQDVLKLNYVWITLQNVGDPSTISELVNSLHIITENAENTAGTSGTSNEPTGDTEPVGSITEAGEGSNEPTLGIYPPVGSITAWFLDLCARE
ncbi:uncharacterized protein LOC141594733 [Silene latifolia]|uniref:uncharacterized protein LOC141594733 n=1 Tax=Silene latifolia TaxID=37657 RepID=UPI003D78436D